MRATVNKMSSRDLVYGERRACRSVLEEDFSPCENVRPRDSVPSSESVSSPSLADSFRSDVGWTL
jgi:hypothetical protein